MGKCEKIMRLLNGNTEMGIAVFNMEFRSPD